ncbi:MAG TPA: hypothetical protein PKL31_02590 [Fulvivirga sp.]|nr:hypothetical protein [Fulvivirga sp.]
MNIKSFIYTLTFLSVLFGCSSPEDIFQPIANTLVADAGANQTVAPFTEVTLDGSASTGPEGFSYEWIYNGSESINLSSISEAIVTFTPEKNNIYTFTLRITSNGQFDEATVQITVTGALVLDASSFTGDELNLKDIDGNFGGPDYLINADFTIPAGKTLNVESGQDVTISIADGAGIIVNGSFNINSTILLQASAAGWKGLLVDGGVINGNVNSLTIDKAGSAAFSGQEAAAITFTNSGNLYLSAYMIITNTISDLGMVLTPTTSSNWDISAGVATIDGKIPVKAPIGYLPKMNNIQEVTGNEYIHLTTSGAGVTEGSVTGTFLFSNRKYLIDGDFTAGSPISTSSATIYMKEGAGIVGTEMSINSTTIEGLNGASWKGIAASVNALLNDVTITGAGSATHDTGSFTTTEKAAVYGAFSTAVQVKNCEITNSEGYGVYLDSQTSNAEVSGTTFTNTTNNDVSLPFGMVGSIIKTGNTWSSNTPIALRPSTNNVSSPWIDLGDGVAYLVTENLTVTSSQLTLSPGVHIKFQSGTTLTVNTGIIAEGTVADPIVFEGENNAPGSWNGINLLGTYKMSYCTINNGGENALSGGEKTNVLFNSSSEFAAYPQTNYSFENNTVSNSAGYGVQVFLGKYDPVTSSTTNTYTNNTGGDIKLP